jgi:hypothetical protein
MIENTINRWLTVKKACELSGLSRSTILQFIKAAAFKSFNMTRPGKKWGRRLIEERSLTNFMNKLAAEQQGKGGKTNETTKA